MISSAILSGDGIYRYLLTRIWPAPDTDHDRLTPRRALFVLLNPSTADALKDDPTIRRVVGFAKRWGCNAVDVVNLFALRATDPKALNDHPEPVGPLNDENILLAVGKADMIVCGWGAQPNLRGRDRVVYDLLWASAQAPIQCLGWTGGGHPKHPLYLSNTTELKLYQGPMA